jgi:hypothetical protein
MADFLSRTGSRALTRLGMQSAARQQLLGEADSLQPDYDAVTKAIMDKKLYSADYAPVANEVNSVVNGYMQKYQADPFFAFSREGRKTVKMLRDMIHDPSLKLMEDNAKLADEQYKRASDKDLGGDFVIRGDKVAAIKNNQRAWIDIDDLGKLDTSKGEGILTVDNDHQLTRNVFGVRGEVPTYNMTSIKEIDQKIQSAFSGLGSDEVARLMRDTSAGVDTFKRGKSNTNQLNAVVSNLLNKDLTESDKNTLMSKYLQSNGSPTKSGFNSWLQDRILKVAQGKSLSVDEVKDEQSLSLRNAKTAHDMKMKEAEIGKERLSPAHLVTTGNYGTRPIIRTEKGVATTVQANLLPLDETFKLSNGKSRDENGVEYTSRKLSDLKVFSDATDLGNILLRVASGNGQGSFVNLPNAKDFAVVADDRNGAPAVTFEYSYTDGEGVKQIIPSTIIDQYQAKLKAGQPLPPSIEKYTTSVSGEEAMQMINQAQYKTERDKQAAIADAQRQLETKGYVSVIKQEPFIAAKIYVAKEEGLFGTDQDQELVKPMVNMINQAGYESKNSRTLRDYYKKYSGNGDILDAGAFSYNDEVYELDTRIPVKSFQALHAAYGGTVKGEREDNNIGTMGFFPKFDVVPSNLLDQTSLPNMTGRKQFLTLDAFKNGGN